MVAPCQSMLHAWSWSAHAWQSRFMENTFATGFHLKFGNLLKQIHASKGLHFRLAAPYESRKHINMQRWTNHSAPHNILKILASAQYVADWYRDDTSQHIEHQYPHCLVSRLWGSGLETWINYAFRIQQCFAIALSHGLTRIVHGTSLNYASLDPCVGGSVDPCVAGLH